MLARRPANDTGRRSAATASRRTARCHRASICDVRPCTGVARSHDSSAQRFGNHLMTQADAEHRQRRRAMPARFRATHRLRAAYTARAKARSPPAAVARTPATSIASLRTTSRRLAQPLEVARQVVGEAVVVVDQAESLQLSYVLPRHRLRFSSLRPQRPQHPRRLVPRFFVFLARVRLGHNRRRRPAAATSRARR